MSEFIKVFNEWPVIIQGALGSGLFWLILLIGQYAVTTLSNSYSKHSSKSRKSWLISNRAKLMAVTTSEKQDKSYYLALIKYRASREFYKAVMWVVLGLIANVMFNPMGVIGFVGALYYLFKASDIVSPIYKEGADEELEKINKELLEIIKT